MDLSWWQLLTIALLLVGGRELGFLLFDPRKTGRRRGNASAQTRKAGS
jgi:hypothetical protein